MKTVLAIVGSQEMEALLQRALRKKYALTVCRSVEEGADLLLYKPDALILELCLPGCDGLSFLQQNRSMLPPVVLALSVLVSRAVLEAASHAGVGGLILIPCTGNEVVRQLDALMRKKDPSLSGG